MQLATVVGFVVGLLFGMSTIMTLLGFLGNVLIEVEETLRNISAVSTVVLLVIAVILFVKVRAIAGLIAGAIVGAVLNFILAQNGINVYEIVVSAFGL